jgi:glycosyltransferase involved in cell wall biosynthesis
MRLLYIHDRYGAFGGAEANALATAEELRCRGWTVGLLHGAKTGQGEASWNSVFEPRFPLSAPQGVETAVASFQPDVAYIQNLPDLAALDALLGTGVRTVRMVHDHSLYCMRSYKYNYFTRRICQRAVSSFCVFPCLGVLARAQGGPLPVKWVSYAAKRREVELNRRVRCLVVATHFMKQELIRNGFAPGQIEIHAPVPQRQGPEAQSSFSDRNLIVYSGQITRGKGVDVLLEALALVRVPFECVIFGEGGYRRHCERLCHKLGLGQSVTFRGFVAAQEITRCYREATVAVMSSVWPEPFGAAGLEAMRYGLPVVAFDAGGIKEWLTDGVNGYLVPWMDRTLYAARIEALLKDKVQARAMGERGRYGVARSFSFSQYLDGLERLFLRVAAPSQPQTASSSPSSSSPFGALASTRTTTRTIAPKPL